MKLTQHLSLPSLGKLFLALTLFFPAQSAIAASCDIGTPGTSERVAIGNSGRTMMVHMPRSEASARKLPLVFLLHGSGGNGADILRASGMTKTSDRQGFIVAAPDAGIPLKVGYAWNIPGVPTVAGTIPGPNDPDDVAFLASAIDWLADKGCVDKKRVYATGISGGGRMTSWLGCVASDRFAAIAPVVGLRAGNPLAGQEDRPDPSTCQPSRPVPVLSFAGDKDNVNPVEGGGAGYWQYPMTAALARWAELDGCETGPTRVRTSTHSYEWRYRNCRKGARVTGRIVGGRGHEWVADNNDMWRFFSRYRR